MNEKDNKTVRALVIFSLIMAIIEGIILFHLIHK